MKSKIVLYFTLGFIGLLFLVNLVHGDSLFTGKIDQLPKDTHVYNLRIEHNIMGNIKIVTSDDSDSQDIQVEAVADQELYEKAISIEHIPDPRFPHRSGTLCVNITDAHDEGGEVMPSMASRSFSPSIWAPIISVLSLNYFQGNSGTALSLAAAAIASFSMFSAQEAQALEEFKVDVTVYVPQNLKLNIIDINIRNGTIEIDDSIAYYPMCAVGDSDLCPFCCSGNGKCTDTGCQCSPEFQGEDCSQEKPHHVLENTNGLPQKFEVLQYEEYRGEMYILTDGGLYVKRNDDHEWHQISSNAILIARGDFGLFSIASWNRITYIYNSTQRETWNDKEGALPRASSTYGVSKHELVVAQDSNNPKIVRLDLHTGIWEDLNFPFTDLDSSPHKSVHIDDSNDNGSNIWYESRFSGTFKYDGSSWTKVENVAAPSLFRSHTANKRTPEITKKDNIEIPESHWERAEDGLPTEFDIRGTGKTDDGYIFMSLRTRGLGGTYQFDGERWWHVAFPTSGYGEGKLFTVGNNVFVSGHNSLYMLDRTTYEYIHIGKFLGRLEGVHAGEDSVLILNGGTENPKIYQLTLTPSPSQGVLHDLEFPFSNLDGKPHIQLVQDKQKRVWYRSNYSGVFLLENGAWEKASDSSGAISIADNGQIYQSYEITPTTQVATFFVYKGKTDGQHEWKQTHTSAGYGMTGVGLSDNGSLFFAGGRFPDLVLLDTKKWMIPSTRADLNLTTTESRGVRTRHSVGMDGVAYTVQYYTKDDIDYVRVLRVKVNLEEGYYDSNLSVTGGKYLTEEPVEGSAIASVIFPNNGNILVALNTNDNSSINTPIPLNMIEVSEDHPGMEEVNPQGILMIFDTEGHSVLKAWSLPSSVLDVTIKDDRFIVVASGHHIFYFDIEQEQVVWKFDFESNKKRVSVKDDFVIAMTSNSDVYLLDLQEGSVIWDKSLRRSYVEDVEIDVENDRVFVVGFDNKRLPSGNPVQVAYLMAYNLDGDFEYQLFGFDGDDLSNNIADTRLYRCRMGQDGTILLLGESAGSQTIFRYNGKAYEGNEVLTGIDYHNALWNTRSPHIAYHAKIDPVDGEIILAQLTMARRSDGESNSFRVRGIAGNANGQQFVVGSCTFESANRNAVTVNGVPVGQYSGGDPSFLYLSEDYRNRLYWHPLTMKDDQGRTMSSGYSRSVDVDNRKVVVLSELQDDTAGPEPLPNSRSTQRRSQVADDDATNRFHIHLSVIPTRN